MSKLISALDFPALKNKPVEEMDITENFTLVKEKKKRKDRSDEECHSEEITTKKEKKKCTTSETTNKMSPLSDIDKDIKSYKRFERELKNMKLEEMENEDLQEIKTRYSEMFKMITLLKEENDNLKQNRTDNSIDEKLRKLEEVINVATSSIKQLKNNQKGTLSYADRVKIPAVVKENSNATETKRHVVAIYPGTEKNIKSSDETKTSVMSCMAPTKEKLKICAVKKISNNGILIETKTREDLERVLKSEKLQAAGFNTGEPSKKKPMLIVYNVPKEINDKEFAQALRNQNMDDYQKSKFAEEVSISHRSGSRSADTVNLILEVSPNARNILQKK